jgi:hypothetical protein
MEGEEDVGLVATELRRGFVAFEGTGGGESVNEETSVDP